MGGAFARHLIAAGYEVIGYDVVPAKLAQLRRRGGRAASSCAEVAARARIVVTSLPDAASFERAFFDKRGIEAGARRGTVVIETSTLPLALRERACTRLARRGVTLLDCPISGTGAQAQVRDIAVYASGERRAYSRCRRVFAAFARAAHYVGEFGAGSKLKYIANLLVTIHNLSAAEAMVLAEKAGLDLALVYRVIRDGAGTSRMFEVRGPLMVARDYARATMKVDVFSKDIDIIRSFAAALDCPTPLFDAATLFYAAALARGMAKRDTASIHAVLRELSGLGAGRRGARGRRPLARKAGQ